MVGAPQMTLGRVLCLQSSYFFLPFPPVYCYYQLYQAFVREELGCQSVCKQACRCVDLEEQGGQGCAEPAAHLHSVPFSPKL